MVSSEVKKAAYPMTWGSKEGRGKEEKSPFQGLYHRNFSLETCTEREKEERGEKERKKSLEKQTI